MSWYAPLISAATGGLYDLIKGAIQGSPEQPDIPGQASQIMPGPMQAASQVIPTQMPQVPGSPPPQQGFGNMPQMNMAAQRAMQRYMGG